MVEAKLPQVVAESVERYRQAGVYLPEIRPGDRFSGNHIGDLEGSERLVRFRRVEEGARFVIQGFLIDGEGVSPLETPKDGFPTEMLNVDWQYVRALTIDQEVS